jgi:hypothetical protein
MVNMMCYSKQQPNFLPDMTLNTLETISVCTAEHCLCPTIPCFMGDSYLIGLGYVHLPRRKHYESGMNMQNNVALNSSIFKASN